MAVYKSPKGVLYNLDKFVSYEVKSDGYQRAGDDGALFKLVAQTETDREVPIYSANHRDAKKRCNDELDEIRRILSLRASVSVVLDAETRKSLCDIKSELKALRRQIGKAG